MATTPKKPAAKAASKTAVATVKRAQVALPADIQEKMASDVAAFQQRMAAPTGNRIAVTQDRMFRAPGGEKFDSMRGVIVDFVSKKAWYEGAYDKDNIVPPNCFALDFAPHNSLIPSENSPDCQHTDCRTCPKNAFKSADNGKGKACKDSYVLVILAPDAEPDTPLMTIELSATAITAYDKYVRDLARDFGSPPYGFITEFYMDGAVDYPSVRCGNPEDIRKTELMAIAVSRQKEAAEMLQKEPDTSEFEAKVVAARKPARGAGKAARR